MMYRPIALLLVLLTLTALSTAGAQSNNGNNGQIIVPNDYPSIQEAIDHANSGSTVFVRSGTYEECVTINKPLTLIGEDKATTTILGGWQLGGTIVLVNHDNVTVSGFTIQTKANGTHGNSIRGIHLLNVRGCTVSGCTFSKIGTGIWLYGSSDNTIQDNLIDGTPQYVGYCLLQAWAGVTLQYSPNNNIHKNTLTDIWESGIGVFNSDGNKITQNYVKTNWWGLKLASSNNNIIEDNSLTGFRFGILQDTSSYTAIKNNTFSSCLTGIQVNNSSFYNLIEKNTITNSNYCGIELHYSTNHNSVIANNIKDNKHGLEIKSSTDNTLKYNNITGSSKIGVIFVNASNNFIQKNNFIKNTQHISSGESKNTWSADGKGNYWDNYNGADANNDGIGDSQYFIDESNIDYYPLMKNVNMITLEIWILSPIVQTYNESDVRLNFTVSNAVDSTAYSLDGTGNVTFTGNLTLAGLTNGLHNVTIYANDTFDNAVSSEIIFLSISARQSSTEPPVAIASIILIGSLGMLSFVELFLYIRKRKRQKIQLKG